MAQGWRSPVSGLLEGLTTGLGLGFNIAQARREQALREQWYNTLMQHYREQEERLRRQQELNSDLAKLKVFFEIVNSNLPEQTKLKTWNEGVIPIAKKWGLEVGEVTEFNPDFKKGVKQLTKILKDPKIGKNPALLRTAILDTLAEYPILQGSKVFEQALKEVEKKERAKEIEEAFPTTDQNQQILSTTKKLLQAGYDLSAVNNLLKQLYPTQKPMIIDTVDAQGNPLKALVDYKGNVIQVFKTQPEAKYMKLTGVKGEGGKTVTEIVKVTPKGAETVTIREEVPKQDIDTLLEDELNKLIDKDLNKTQPPKEEQPPAMIKTEAGEIPIDMYAQKIINRLNQRLADSPEGMIIRDKKSNIYFYRAKQGWIWKWYPQTNLK